MLTRTPMSLFPIAAQVLALVWLLAMSAGMVAAQSGYSPYANAQHYGPYAGQPGAYYSPNATAQYYSPYAAALNGYSPNQIRLVQDVQPSGDGTTAAATAAPSDMGSSLRGLSAERSALATGPATGYLPGSESFNLPALDAGGFLGKSGSVSNSAVQLRNPIANDVRTRGNHVGQMVGSGSYWIPARMDLDTMLSKIDSRLIEDMIVIKGPYSAIYGPGFNFVDFQLLAAPRSPRGPASGGSTSAEFQSNGEGAYGRQTFWRAAEDYGVRISYGHKIGNDYETGGSGPLLVPGKPEFGTSTFIPSSYNSRDVEVAIGFDLSPDSTLDFHYLRLDQTDMEYPGLIFDMDFLVTDAYELKYVSEDQSGYERLAIEGWYNNTRFAGDSTSAAKELQIPVSKELNAFTNVETASAGYRAAVTWDDMRYENSQFTLGTDLIYLTTALNDLEPKFKPGNFPIPKSHSTDVGFFGEYAIVTPREGNVKIGSRVDFVSTDAARSTPNPFGPPDPVLTAAILEENDMLEQNFTLWSLFATAELPLNDVWSVTAGAGHAMRPPTLTELYAQQSFIGAIQETLTDVLGDPHLDPEKATQIDLGLGGEFGVARVSINGFHAWIHDYITYDYYSFFVIDSSQGNDLESLQNSSFGELAFVNTDLATLAGFELSGEVDYDSQLSFFSTMSFVEGRDHSRDSPSRLREFVVDGSGDRVFGPDDQVRSESYLLDANPPPIPVGPFSNQEPLSQIPPLETRLGFRLRSSPSQKDTSWNTELGARIVSRQERVASSLFEQPTPGFTTYYVRGSWQVSRNLLVSGGVENIFDKFYREHLDYRVGRGVFQPGTNIYCGGELTY